MTSEAEWKSTLAALHEQEGGLDLLVNNAAILLLQPIDQTSGEDFERVMRVNALGPFLGTRSALPLLRQAAALKGDASIVNVGSTDSLSGTTTTAAYTASKFALSGLTRVTALENGKYRVRANILCPRAGSAEMQVELSGVCGDDVLDTYADERDPHARDLVDRAVSIGKLMEVLAAREAGEPDPHPPESLNVNVGGPIVPPMRGGAMIQSQTGTGKLAGKLLRQPRVRARKAESGKRKATTKTYSSTISSERASVSLEERRVT